MPDQAPASALAAKVVVVTGAARGIGRAIAKLAAHEGAAVVVADTGGAVDGAGPGAEAPAHDCAAEISAEGGTAVAWTGDVSTLEGAEAVVAHAVAALGRIDAIVCCAGILVHGRVHELAESDWDRVIAVHLKGHFACTQAAARAMIEAGSGGRILHFSSAAALKGPELQPSYAAAKAGILALTKSSARALAPYGITVNCILPGASTRMTDKVWREWTGRTDIAGLSLPSDHALGTWRDPANVAPFCVHLLSERGGRISGRAFAVVGDQVSLLREPEYGPHIASSIGEDVADLAERADTAFGDLGGPADSPWPPPARVTVPAR